MTTEFMINLSKKLIEVRHITESSASSYIRTLFTLNDKAVFKNLAFLKKTETIMSRIEHYAESTQKTLLSGVVSVLSLYEDKPTYKKTYQFYYDRMMGKRKEIADTTIEGKKTETQEKNWLTWEEVNAKRNELMNQVNSFLSQKTITAKQYETLQKYLILSLYTEQPPRRNQDYLDMYVSKKKADALPKDKNYLLMEGNTPKSFVFNRYKTARKYGTQVQDIPESLAQVISHFMKYHPTTKTTEYKLLVNYDGSPINAPNAITRTLNRIMGKKIGSSMLRHIYLSSKYGVEIQEMKADAQAMGHTIQEAQKTYIKE